MKKLLFILISFMIINLKYNNIFVYGASDDIEDELDIESDVEGNLKKSKSSDDEDLDKTSSDEPEFTDLDEEDDLEPSKKNDDEEDLTEFEDQEEPVKKETTEKPDLPKKDASQHVSVSNIDYQSSPTGGTVVITTTDVCTYTSRYNEQSQQFTVEIQNSELPKNLQRPFHTQEFNSSIGSFQAYQNPGSGVSRIVIQMKDGSQPLLQQDGTKLLIISNMSENQQPASILPADKVLSSQSLEEFLSGVNTFYGKKISLQVRGAELTDVLNFIAEESGANIIMTDDVSGKVTLKLKQVPWDMALIIIMRAHELGYVRQGNVIRISKLDKLKKESDSAKSILDARKNVTPMYTKIFNLSYTKAEDADKSVKDLLSLRGKAFADKRTNSLVVTDINEVLEKIQSLLTSLDTQIPQVLIEAKVVEAREQVGSKIGIQWSTSGTPISLGKSSSGNLNLTQSLQVSSDSSPHFLNLQVGTLPVVGDLDATLNLLETEEFVKVISSPRVVTLHGEEATIQQTTEIPLTSSTVGANGVVATSVSFKPIRLELKVNPQVTNDGHILLSVDVTREFPGAEINGNAPINSRKATTKVIVENGDTTVIGGIYQSDVTLGNSGMPFLKDLPLIGFLFKTTTKSKQKNELLIFLTPKILNKDKAFKTTL